MNELQLVERPLTSGRSVVLRFEGARDELEVYSPTGDLELRIALTDAGPVLLLRACAVALDCRSFEIHATEDVRLRAGGDVHINGATVRLNC